MIPFNRATIAPNQLLYVQEVFASSHLSGDGTFTKRAASHLSRLHEDSPALLTTSCTDALELCALLLDIQPGDEVIVPSFTFVSTANAFALFGARVVFADVRSDTFTIDAEEVAGLITDRTKAVVTVHYGGVDGSTLRLNELAKSHGFRVVEDNAHGLFGSNLGRPLGTRSALSTLSFHETKNVTCGEGGALIVNDSTLLERAEIMREKGTNRSRFFRGQVDKYTWESRGSSFLPSDINAAVLLSQLEFSEEIQRRRRSAETRFRSGLACWAANNGVQFQQGWNATESPSHLFAMLLPDAATRARFLDSVRSLGVSAVFHYLPLHSSAAGLRYGIAPSGCAVTTDIAERLVRLPLFSDQTRDEVEKIVSVVTEFQA